MCYLGFDLSLFKLINSDQVMIFCCNVFRPFKTSPMYYHIVFSGYVIYFMLFDDNNLFIYQTVIVIDVQVAYIRINNIYWFIGIRASADCQKVSEILYYIQNVESLPIEPHIYYLIKKNQSYDKNRSDIAVWKSTTCS